MSDLQNVKLKIFIDGEYKGTIKNGDPLPSEWLGDCGEHTFEFEIDDTETNSNRVTVRKLIDTLQKFNPDAEVWESCDTGSYPMEHFPIEIILDRCDIPTTYLLDDVGKKVVLF
jgi:hypothetical protein